MMQIGQLCPQVLQLQAQSHYYQHHYIPSGFEAEVLSAGFPSCCLTNQEYTPKRPLFGVRTRYVCNDDDDSHRH